MYISFAKEYVEWKSLRASHSTDRALGARAGALLQARVRGQSRRAVLKQAPDPLAVILNNNDNE
ncbi:hypothetical protein [Sphingobacterium sp. 1.A.5]|uniref:hypothetical protein n=1 Tax=Sphingobacterium sp. 1.A.5 TaxID=2044604 RepID=UPI001C55860D|nr:hypothetical protein [Sphingobacterium sp. 1.A.5]